MDYEKELTARIIGAAIEIHRRLGPGLLESSYQACLAKEFDLRSLPYRKEVALPLEYKGVSIETGYRLDFVVEEKVVIEVKSVEKIRQVHEAQLMTYMKLSKLRLGLLLNFNVPVLKNGIVRRIL